MIRKKKTGKEQERVGKGMTMIMVSHMYKGSEDG